MKGQEAKSCFETEKKKKKQIEKNNANLILEFLIIPNQKEKFIPLLPINFQYSLHTMQIFGLANPRRSCWC